MAASAREIVVISDLHIGGRYEEGGRGFRMCPRRSVEALARLAGELAARTRQGATVELVINGDFVDFLAEEHFGTPAFLPFIHDPGLAVRVLQRIMERDAVFFDALAELLAAGGWLTVLLGNHDVELSLSPVRRALVERLTGGKPVHLGFVYDGEAYGVGDVLIEHGNRYDGFNVVDHDTLRRTRSLLSREQPIGERDRFAPPPGSRLVAEIMNPIKKLYPFIDLLKPETETVLPLLLALEPGYRDHVFRINALKSEANRHEPAAPGRPALAGDIAAVSGRARRRPLGAGTEGAAAPVARSELSRLLGQWLAPAEAEALSASIDPPRQGVSSDIASTAQIAKSVGTMLLAGRHAELSDRMPALLSALRIAQHDRSFDRGMETNRSYLDAAVELTRGRFKTVVFGHTHLAKDVDLDGGRRYLNSGTWAELIEFPQSLLEPSNPRALEALADFVEDMRLGRFEGWITLRPTYVKIAMADGTARSTALVDCAP